MAQQDQPGSTLTNLQISNDDVASWLQPKSTLVDLACRSNADNGLVVCDGDLRAKGCHSDTSADLDDVRARSGGVPFQIGEVVDGDYGSATAAGCTAVEACEAVSNVIARGQDGDDVAG